MNKRPSGPGRSGLLPRRPGLEGRFLYGGRERRSVFGEGRVVEVLCNKIGDIAVHAFTHLFSSFLDNFFFTLFNTKWNLVVSFRIITVFDRSGCFAALYLQGIGGGALPFHCFPQRGEIGAGSSHSVPGKALQPGGRLSAAAWPVRPDHGGERGIFPRLLHAAKPPHLGLPRIIHQKIQFH